MVQIQSVILQIQSWFHAVHFGSLRFLMWPERLYRCITLNYQSRYYDYGEDFINLSKPSIITVCERSSECSLGEIMFT